MKNPLHARIASYAPEDRRQAAASPETPQHLLEQLVADPAASVRAAVAANPNISLALADRLVEEFPDEVMANPAIDQFALENPGWIKALSHQAQRAVCGHPLLPDTARRWVLNQRGMPLIAYLAENPSLSAERQNEIASKITSHAHDSLHIGLMSQPHPTPQVLAVLSVCQYDGVRVHAASHPDTPGDVLQRLALDPAPEVRSAVSRNPALPRATAEILFRAGADATFSSVSGHYGTLTEDEQTYLIEAEGPYGRCLLAQRHDLTRNQITRLAGDEDPAVRAMLGSNPILPVRTLFKLLFDDEPDVRLATLKNPEIPEEASSMRFHVMSGL